MYFSCLMRLSADVFLLVGEIDSQLMHFFWLAGFLADVFFFFLVGEILS